MFDSKLIELLSRLSPAERRRFRKWVKSPVHNANERLSTFYDVIDKKENFSERSLSKAKIYTTLYGEAPYDDVKIRRDMSELLKVLEAFLVYEQWLEHPEEQRIALAAAYRTRQLSSDAGAHLEKAEELLGAQPERDARFYLNRYRIQEERLLQHSGRDSALNLQEMADELTHFFVAEQLRNACSALSHAAVYRTEYEFRYLEAIMTDCAAGRYRQAPFIMLYYHIYCYSSRPDAHLHFQAYKEILGGAAAWLSAKAYRDALLFGVNYCIRRMHMDELAYLREVFELYKLGLARDIFLENGVLSRFSYKNIVAAALKLGETDWTERFLLRYTPMLQEAYRSDYERFCRAKLCFQRGDYNAVQDLLFDLAFDDVFLALDARVLLLKIYFETGKWRLLEGFLKAFERFVGRKKMLAYHGPNYRNIVQFAGKLMLLKSGKRVFSPEETTALREQITAARPLTERDWLLQLMD